MPMRTSLIILAPLFVALIGYMFEPTLYVTQSTVYHVDIELVPSSFSDTPTKRAALSSLSKHLSDSGIDHYIYYQHSFNWKPGDPPPVIPNKREMVATANIIDSDIAGAQSRKAAMIAELWSLVAFLERTDTAMRLAAPFTIEPNAEMWTSKPKRRVPQPWLGALLGGIVGVGLSLVLWRRFPHL